MLVRNNPSKRPRTRVYKDLRFCLHKNTINVLYYPYKDRPLRLEYNGRVCLTSAGDGVSET